MSAIKKLVIPVAGFGTRFLPATKAQPKEMLPLVDKPIIQHIIESAVASGIEDIILVTGKTKRAIEDHFDQDEFLERYLIEAGKEKYADKIKRLSKMANFVYIRQKGPYGNGTPVLNAKHIIGDEPFAVVWGDDVWKTKEVPHLKQLIEVFDRYKEPVVSAMFTDDVGTSKYGIIDGVEVSDGVIEVKSILEKPGPEKTKSRVASVGGYILTPDIFEALEETTVGKDNELWLVDAIARLLTKRPIYAKVIEGEYLDLGSKLGWLKANVQFGLEDDEAGVEFREYLKHIIEDR